LTNPKTNLKGETQCIIFSHPARFTASRTLGDLRVSESKPAANSFEDERWMRRALELADAASARGEIPVGAVIVCDGAIIAESGNLKEASQDPLGHAEVIAIREAARALGRWRLSGCTLYVTLEPCTMCSGAIIHARLDRVVYAATDPKAGAVSSLYQILADPRLNHAPLVEAGVLQEEASLQLKNFFRALRKK
jgi:tRNA(adenine34) deaminase